MKILIVINDFSVGGAERVTGSLVREFYRDGHSVTLLLFNTKKDNPILSSISDKAEIISFSKEKFPNAFFLAGMVRFFLLRRKFDVILCNLQPAAFYIGLLLPIIQCPVVYILHNDYPLLKNPVKRLVLRTFYNSRKVTLVSVSEQIAAGFKLKFKIMPEVITNGILPPAVNKESTSVLKQIETLKKDQATLVFIGIQRLVWFKNLVVLAEAFRDIHETGYNAILILIGGDPSAGKAEEHRIRSAGAPNVFLLGQKDNIADYLVAADCFCIVSSAFEGSPIALLEAISHGLPVIGTRTGGIASIIEDPVNGILCEPSRESITQAIIRFIDMPAGERKRIREANIRLFNEQYHEKIMAEKYKGLVSRVTSKAK